MSIIDKLNVHISHVYKGKNKVADSLLVMGIQLHAIQWWDSYPKVYTAMVNNAIGIESIRFC